MDIKNIKEKIKSYLLYMWILSVSYIGITITIYRIKNPEQTETQLFLNLFNILFLNW